jgi:hypothetical protein
MTAPTSVPMTSKIIVINEEIPADMDFVTLFLGCSECNNEQVAVISVYSKPVCRGKVYC